MESNCKSCHQFFGHIEGFCSKCYKEQVRAVLPPAPQSTVEPAKVELPIVEEVLSVPNQCAQCNRRLGPVKFTCKCANTFCPRHRLPEQHQCQFDHISEGRDRLAQSNPQIVSEKFNRL